MRDKSPQESSDRRTPYIPPHQEIYQSGLLGPALRPSLRSREALLKALLPCEDTDCYSRFNTRCLMAGITAIGTERKRQRSLTPLKPQAAQPNPVHRTRTASSSDLHKDEQGRFKYFNAEIIPKKAPRTVSLQEIERYLKYVGTKPFK